MKVMQVMWSTVFASALMLVGGIPWTVVLSICILGLLVGSLVELFDRD